MAYFKPKDKIANYTVTFLVKESVYAETYRVKDLEGTNYLLKLIVLSKLNRTQFDTDRNVEELEIAKKLKHQNTVHLHDYGEFTINAQPLLYLVFDYVSGETISQKMIREGEILPYDAVQIATGILQALEHIHNSSPAIIHNEITIQNVMIDMAQGSNKPVLIDFGHAHFEGRGRNVIKTNDLNPFYLAPEIFNGLYTPASDIYSVGVMLYHMIYGDVPHFIDISRFNGDYEEFLDTLDEEKQRPIQINHSDIDVPEHVINAIAKAITYNVDARFNSATEFTQALNKEPAVSTPNIVEQKQQTKTSGAQSTKKKGGGFADIAGMQYLKDQLQSDVIEVLRHPEEAASLGISVPNGLLFYGPPGCGKTFFAEKFAEEVGCNYMYIRCSDVATQYIHGGQEKIANIFAEARSNAPTILFLDELDAMIADRGMQNNTSMSGEVNEFLTQLNNCGKDKVIVIGATNNPMMIDKAALRAGRLEMKYYISQPDFDTRIALFKVNLEKRSRDFGIDYERLASLTENYVSSDITLIVDNAARKAFRNRTNLITMELLEEVIKESRSSISLEEIKEHEKIRDIFEQRRPKKEERRKIGF